MATMKEFALIFEDLSIEIVEVVIDKNIFSNFCLTNLQNDFRNKLNQYLKEKNYKLRNVIPNTALYSGNFDFEIQTRKATNDEKEEYLLINEEMEYEPFGIFMEM